MLPETSPALSPLEALSQRRFEGHTFIRETVVSVGTSLTPFLRNDPNRLFWAAINEGVNDVHISTDPSITTTSGWLLPASGGVISMFWEQDGEGVGYAVYAIATGAAVNVRVREVIRS